MNMKLHIEKIKLKSSGSFNLKKNGVLEWNGIGVFVAIPVVLGELSFF